MLAGDHVGTGPSRNNVDSINKFRLTFMLQIFYYDQLLFRILNSILQIYFIC